MRTFSINEYGVWMLFMSITTILEVLRNGFIRNPLVRYINTTHNAEYRFLTSTALWMNLFFTVLTSLIIFLTSEWVSSFLNAPQLAKILWIYILTNFALIPFSHFEFIQQANFSFIGTFVSYFLRNLLICLYVGFCYLSSAEITLSKLAYFNAFAVLTSALVSFLFARKYLSKLSLPKREWFMKLFHYGKYTFGTNVNSMLSKNIDHWLLGHLISPASVAIYNPAIRISNLVEVPTMALSNILFPKIAQVSKSENKKDVKRLYEKSVGLIMCIMLPAAITVFLFSDFIVYVLAGDSYADSASILKITIFYTLYIPFMRFFGNVLDAVNRPKVNFYFVLFMALSNVLFNYLFISFFGVMGAAYGTMTTFFLFFILNQLYLKIHFDISTFACFRESLGFYVLSYKWSLSFIRGMTGVVEK